MIEVPPAWLERLREYSSLPDMSVDLGGGELVWLATRLYREYRRMDACSTLAVEGLVLEMLALAGRGRIVDEKSRPVWLPPAVDLLRARFREYLTLNEIAADVGVHPFHLSRVFRRFQQQTPGEYVHRLRVQFACERLTDPGADLATIALESGFADQSHMTRVFKQVTGTTPGAFRAALQG